MNAYGLDMASRFSEVFIVAKKIHELFINFYYLLEFLLVFPLQQARYDEWRPKTIAKFAVLPVVLGKPRLA